MSLEFVYFVLSEGTGAGDPLVPKGVNINLSKNYAKMSHCPAMLHTFSTHVGKHRGVTSACCVVLALTSRPGQGADKTRGGRYTGSPRSGFAFILMTP